MRFGSASRHPVEFGARLPGKRIALFVTAAALVAMMCHPDWESSTENAAADRHPVPLGAYLGSDEEGMERIAAFQSWLGAPVKVGHTYLAGDNWLDVEGPDWVIKPWARWRAADPARMLVLNVPMLTPNEADLPDDLVAAQLRSGADGAYDSHYVTLAERLVAAGAADTIIVLGWEMNGVTFSGRCGPDPAMWKRYWRRIVTAVRSVPGARFRFDFAPNRGPDAVAWPDCYPGDDVVDIIGMDAYDQPGGAGFRDFVDEPYGLRAQADFAKVHGKPISFPEWGLYRNGDNPDYVRGLHNWINTHDVLYQTITDYCPHGVWGCGGNPGSTSAYKKLFGAPARSSSA